MELAELLDRLKFTESPKFLRRGSCEFESAPDYGHHFRRATADPCSLQGVYTLQPGGTTSKEAIVPIVYVCDVTDEAKAEEVHRLVWNQDVVPFLIVNSPECVRAYSGFRYRRSGKETKGLLKETAGTDLEQDLMGLDAESIDDGRVWDQWGKEVTPEHRVDWRLLDNLNELGAWLQDQGGMRDRHAAHALIGKYVFLHYLRAREILSDRKLDLWKIPATEIFGRTATVDGLRAVCKELEPWLNGNIFPIDFTDGELTDNQVRRVAGTFKGDRLEEDGAWQLHLDFQAYDFSYIPIETLSVVYQQFLHSSTGEKGKTKGRALGAYYTPIPVVNLMLSELEERRPLGAGTRIFDPACGSGAFLVQAYRRLIEREFPPGGTVKPTVPRLRKLLVDHVFGLDLDPDACSVTELSLVLTMLDYVHPPDLEGPGRPHLPPLRNRNIFQGNFFDSEGESAFFEQERHFDLVVGNPPWKQLHPQKLDDRKPEDREDLKVWEWMKPGRENLPVGSNQMARAFAWRVVDFLAEDGEIALFLPAMTLFEDPARDFRRKFFSEMKVHTVVNFSNLAEVISAGRFRVPAAAFFYRPRKEAEAESDGEDAIRVYSPLVANQEATRSGSSRKRNESWSIVINASDIRDIPAAEAIGGDALPWKLAMWGSHLDKRLLSSLDARFGSLGQCEESGLLFASEGLPLRRPGENENGEAYDRVADLLGRSTLDMAKLAKQRRFFVFPTNVIVTVGEEYDRVREGRGELPLRVCRPPHVIVSAARNFAVYSEEFLIVPPRQIGIVSPADDKNLLKALSLYLSSDFAFYHQFLTSTQFGVQRGVATLDALRQIPIPFGKMDRNELREWASLHGRLVGATRKAFAERDKAEQPLLKGLASARTVPQELLDELNSLVYESLGMDSADQALVRDLVHVRLELNDGKIGEPAVRPPDEKEMREYAERLKADLDDFVGKASTRVHRVQVVHDALSGMVEVHFTDDKAAARTIIVAEATKSAASALEKTRRRLRQERSQWVYFDRNLRIYEGRRTYVLKPMQRFHWTVTQARLDAAEVIAETLDEEGAD